MSLTFFEPNGTPFEEACRKITTHRCFRTQMSDAALLNTIQTADKRWIQETTKFIIPSELNYNDFRGRAGRVYRELEARWEYDAGIYSNHHIYPDLKKFFVVLVDADSVCTKHRYEHALQNDYITGRQVINIDSYLESFPIVDNAELRAELPALGRRN